MINTDMIIIENIPFFMKTSFLINAFMHPHLNLYLFYCFYPLSLDIRLPPKKRLPATCTESLFSYLTPRFFSWYSQNIRIRTLCVIADYLIGSAKCGSTWLGLFILYLFSFSIWFKASLCFLQIYAKSVPKLLTV